MLSVIYSLFSVGPVLEKQKYTYTTEKTEEIHSNDIESTSAE